MYLFANLSTNNRRREIKVVRSKRLFGGSQRFISCGENYLKVGETWIYLLCCKALHYIEVFIILLLSSVPVRKMWLLLMLAHVILALKECKSLWKGEEGVKMAFGRNLWFFFIGMHVIMLECASLLSEIRMKISKNIFFCNPHVKWRVVGMGGG